ncbi:ANTAR domain-containing response regulator [Cypionkella psychrotolerans]|uniref:ANTAR domain-containing response regulator n=1 Tax=Cypionkella psychrotolerans TaxID=1678131 RepID=UPI0006B601E7|nr:ANTAR domain-containing protein [Cypionkella psychrotolerans]
MKRQVRSKYLGGARALILHRPHLNVLALARQLRAIGLVVDEAWPELGAQALATDFIFFDADMGYDGQFPWPAGEAPMPMIAMIGSEAPGRIEWSLQIGAHAQLLKPITGSGVYSAVLIARDAFDRQRAQAAEIADLRRRLDGRRAVVRAVMLLMQMGKSEADAYGQLRQMAMSWQISFEDAALRVVARYAAEGGDDQRNRG